MIELGIYMELGILGDQKSKKNQIQVREVTFFAAFRVHRRDISNTFLGEVFTFQKSRGKRKILSDFQRRFEFCWVLSTAEISFSLHFWTVFKHMRFYKGIFLENFQKLLGIFLNILFDIDPRTLCWLNFCPIQPFFAQKGYFQKIQVFKKFCRLPHQNLGLYPCIRARDATFIFSLMGAAPGFRNYGGYVPNQKLQERSRGGYIGKY